MYLCLYVCMYLMCMYVCTHRIYMHRFFSTHINVYRVLSEALASLFAVLRACIAGSPPAAQTLNGWVKSWWSSVTSSHVEIVWPLPTPQPNLKWLCQARMKLNDPSPPPQPNPKWLSQVMPPLPATQTLNGWVKSWWSWVTPPHPPNQTRNGLKLSDPSPPPHPKWLSQVMPPLSQVMM